MEKQIITEIIGSQMSYDFDFLQQNYRVIKHFGSNTIEILIWEKGGLFKKDGWRRIYFGHADPLKRSLKFFDTFVGKDVATPSN